MGKFLVQRRDLLILDERYLGSLKLMILADGLTSTSVASLFSGKKFITEEMV